MEAELHRYHAYKNSGVPWLGDVPEHWSVLRGRHLFEIKKRIAGELGHPVLSVTQAGLRVRDVQSNEGQVSQDYSKYQIVHSGDFVMNSMDLITGGVGIADSAGVTSPDYRVFAIRDITLCRDRYVLHVFRTLYKNRGFYAWGQGSAQLGRWRLPRKRFNEFPFPVPPVPEQAAIVRFLDHVDRRIQRYIRVKQKLIKLLEEQKQVIIHRAVTRGLDPNVCLKPSGVEWLGDVPEHWKVTRFKAVLSRPMRNGLFKKKDAFGSGVLLVNVGDVYRENFQIDPAALERVQATPDEILTYKVRSGDLFIVRSSLKLEGTGRSAVAISCESDTVFECHLVQGRPDLQRVRPRFLAFQLNSFALRHYLIAHANVVTMATVAQDVLASCPVLLPSLSEQEGLLLLIDDECARIDAAINRSHREISLLREYRTRLIADAITGKLDVREAAAWLPDEFEKTEPFEDAEAHSEIDTDTPDELDANTDEAEA
jgi:type I restriction enzyme, S subunit